MTSKLLALADLYAERKPGCCLICDEPLPPPNPRGAREQVLCKTAACQREYWRMYHRAYKYEVRRRGPLLHRPPVEPTGRLLW